MPGAARAQLGCSTEASSLGLERALALRERAVYFDSGVSLRYVTRVSAVHDHQRALLWLLHKAAPSAYGTILTVPYPGMYMLSLYARYLAVPATWFPHSIESRRLGSNMEY